MQPSFQALILRNTEPQPTAALEQYTLDQLSDGDVVVRVEFSSLNYKDALAVTGQAKIARKFPLVPGIDLAGTVESSASPDYQPGDEVLLTGWGVGEQYDGGYAQYARVRSEWLLPMPSGLTPQTAMTIGTAGFTAMLCVMALQEQGVRPNDGEILVTGATGGVGSMAILLLAAAGYSVTACTGKQESARLLQKLGAKTVIDRGPFEGQPRALARSKWAGAVDVVGSTTLAHVLSQMNYGGVVAACGMAQGLDLPASVAPFILRGVRLLGVDSVMCPRARRQKAWQQLAESREQQLPSDMTRVISLAEVPAAAQRMLSGEVTGRLIVTPS